MTKAIEQLKQKDLALTRAKLLKQQNNTCLLCNRTTTEINRTFHVDHAHSNEPHAHHVRAALCPICNTTSGAVWKMLIRKGITGQLGTKGVIQWLRALADHMEADYSMNPYHPQRIKDEVKRFKLLGKKEQQLELEQLGITPKGTKADLVKQYTKFIKGT